MLYFVDFSAFAGVQVEAANEDDAVEKARDLLHDFFAREDPDAPQMSLDDGEPAVELVEPLSEPSAQEGGPR